MNTSTPIWSNKFNTLLTVYFVNGNFYVNDYESFCIHMKKISDPIAFFKNDNNRAGWFNISYSELYEMYKELTILLLPDGLLFSTIWGETLTFFYVVKSQTKQVNYANLFDENGVYLWV